MTLKDPTGPEAEVFGMLVWSGIPAVDAVPFAAPFTDEAVWPDLAKAWPRSKPVLDVLVRLQGGAWTDLTDVEKVEKALAYALRCQAWVVMSQNPQEVQSERRSLYLTCLKDLRAQQAGRAPGDESVAYFKKALALLETTGRATPKAETH